jgi:hypothetical protein
MININNINLTVTRSDSACVTLYHSNGFSIFIGCNIYEHDMNLELCNTTLRDLKYIKCNVPSIYSNESYNKKSILIKSKYLIKYYKNKDE